MIGSKSGEGLLKELEKEGTRKSLKVFSAISHQNRAQILDTVYKDGKISYTGLNGILNVSKKTLNDHLDVLQEAQLIEFETVGDETFYKLTQYGKELLT